MIKLKKLCKSSREKIKYCVNSKIFLACFDYFFSGFVGFLMIHFLARKPMIISGKVMSYAGFFPLMFVFEQKFIANIHFYGWKIFHFRIYTILIAQTTKFPFENDFLFLLFVSAQQKLFAFKLIFTLNVHFIFFAFYSAIFLFVATIREKCVVVNKSHRNEKCV